MVRKTKLSIIGSADNNRYIRTPAIPAENQERLTSRGVIWAEPKDAASASLHIASDAKLNGMFCGFSLDAQITDFCRALYHDRSPPRGSPRVYGYGQG